MSLLDFFSGKMSPEAADGLLAFGSGMLRASGPSTKPRSFGLSLAGGAEALQEAEQQQGAKQMQSLQARLYGVQLQDAESDLKNQEALRERAKALQEFYRSRGATPGGQAERDASGVAPAVGSREQPGGVPVAPGSGAGGGLGASLFRQRLAESQALRAAGFGQEADAAEAAALKLQPKVKELKQVQAGGKVMYAPIFEDGTPGEPIPYEAAVELARANTGGSTDLYNPITGATVRSMRNTASPDAVLSASTARRGQDMADRRAAEAQEFQRSTSKVPAGYRMLSDGSMQAIPGGPADPRAGKEGLQRTQDARDVLSLLDEALPLLKTATSSYGGAALDQVGRVVGLSTAGADAAAQLKVIQAAVVSKMPKMTGPQSDKDVQLYREAAGQLGDPTLPVSQRLAAEKMVRSIQLKYAGPDAAPVPQPPEGGGASAAPARKTATLADIAETARRSGKTTAEVTAALRAKGYTIGGK